MMAIPAPTFKARVWPMTSYLALIACHWSVPHEYSLLFFRRRQNVTAPPSRVGTRNTPLTVPM
uniref:Uncharacterized protein n=1 Tax=Arundo donax TaxID=35708 RepID=A0A0A9FQR2_ARUDO